MEKYLVTIEFRYSDAPEYEGRSTSKNKTLTIGYGLTRKCSELVVNILNRKNKNGKY
jgi:hypothetical protein